MSANGIFFLISTKSGQLLDVIQLFTVKFLFLEAFFFVKWAILKSEDFLGEQ